MSIPTSFCRTAVTSKAGPIDPRSRMVQEEQRDWRKSFGWALAVCAVCAVALLHARYCLFLAVGTSMLPTLRFGDLLVVDKGAYEVFEPRRGDIVVGRLGQDVVVKRVVGLPGEQVEILGGELYIDDELMPEGHATETCPDFNISKGKIFAGKFATIGDNRAVDPRRAVHPIFSKNQIVGRVLFSVRLSDLVAGHLNFMRIHNCGIGAAKRTFETKTDSRCLNRG